MIDALWIAYVRTLEWDQWRGMFVKQEAFWSYDHGEAIWAHFIPDVTLFRGTRADSAPRERYRRALRRYNARLAS